ncbi:MAG: ribonuclease HIII [Candidatus Algichlamydia australiensis]|nr:ribonuclease HIII [Chlamydiales bacterium]
MACFVTKLKKELFDKLHSDLQERGFVFTKPPYTIFSARKPGLIVNLYESGKLTVQGREQEEFIRYYLEPELLQDFSFTQNLDNPDLSARIGIDEAGKGDFFGPLCIGGIYADEQTISQLIKLGVRDSKRMTDPKIMNLATQIKKIVPYSLIRIFPTKYNLLYAKFRNLNELLAWGHASAIEELATKTGCNSAIIDQFASEHVVERAVAKKGLEMQLTQRTGGESDPVVAAASILARTAFLEGMQTLSKQVNLTLPKGAGPQVIEVGRSLVDRDGKEILGDVAKLHFKTRGVILGA